MGEGGKCCLGGRGLMAFHINGHYSGTLNSAEILGRVLFFVFMRVMYKTKFFDSITPQLPPCFCLNSQHVLLLLSIHQGWLCVIPVAHKPIWPKVVTIEFCGFSGLVLCLYTNKKSQIIVLKKTGHETEEISELAGVAKARLQQQQQSVCYCTHHKSEPPMPRKHSGHP